MALSHEEGKYSVVYSRPGYGFTLHSNGIRNIRLQFVILATLGGKIDRHIQKECDALIEQRRTSPFDHVIDPSTTTLLVKEIHEETPAGFGRLIRFREGCETRGVSQNLNRKKTVRGARSTPGL